MKNASTRNDGFLQQIEASRRNADSWPTWMRQSETVATASFPKVASLGAETHVRRESAPPSRHAKQGR